MSREISTTATGAATPSASRNQALGPHWAELLVRRLHTLVALWVGPFLLIAALSGMAYVLTPQLENLLYQDVLTTSSQGRPLSLEAQVEAALRQVDASQTLAAVRPAPAPGATTRVMFNNKALGESQRRALFVDPVSGQVLGEHTVYGTSGSLPLRTQIDLFHRALLLGDIGRYYSELAASWLWLMALGGLGLWVAQWRRKRQVSWTAGRARPLRERHALLGLWLLLGLLFLSVSGLTWSRHAGDNIGTLRKAWGWSTPSVRTTLPDMPLTASSASAETAASSVQSGAGHAHHPQDDGAPATRPVASAADFDQVLALARAQGIDAGKVEIRPPAAPNRAWTVTEIDRSWPTQVDAVAIDGRQLVVVDQIAFDQFPLAAKLTRWAVDLHMGVMFGLPNQLALAATAGGLVLTICWGYTLWWRRRNTAARQPTLWQALGRAPSSARLAMLVAAAALGLALPVMGVGLAVLLLMDLLVHRVRLARG